MNRVTEKWTLVNGIGGEYGGGGGGMIIQRTAGHPLDVALPPPARYTSCGAAGFQKSAFFYDEGFFIPVIR
jgi:hypothetical protein